MCEGVYVYLGTINMQKGVDWVGGGRLWLSEECALGHEYHLTVNNAQTTFGG